MPITPKEAIVIPAKTFDKFWLSSLTIAAPPGGDAVATIVVVPFSDEHGFYHEGTTQFEIKDVLAKASSGNTKISAAYAAILEVVQEAVNQAHGEEV